MSKLQIYIFVGLLTVVALAAAAEEEKQCELQGIKFNKGESISVPGKCEQVTCKDPERQYISGKGCGLFQPRPGCHVGQEDVSKPYPQCCPQEVC